MLATLETRLIAFGALALLVLGGAWYYGHTRYAAGQTDVQAQWDASKAAQAAAIAKASDQAAQHYVGLTNDFNTFSATYEATSHASYPSIADAAASGVSDGSIRLRDNPMCAGAGTNQAATASARAADAAVTAALAERVANSIAAVRVGERSDARERQIGAQVIGLQDVLRAEREIKAGEQP